MLVVPYEPARAEVVVSNSRFIASLSPADSVATARGYMAAIRQEFPDATHHVPAFIIGGGNSVTEFCSDDGEPSGTSGRPLLATLKGSGLGNVVVVVTRYFGGSLLGTGGLVKAYTEAGRAVLANTRRAELVETVRARFSVPYHLFDRARIASADAGATIVSEDFAEDVSLVVDVASAAWDDFTARISELSAGAVRPEAEATTMAARLVQ
ncbi:MAG: YigZ family protein [Spirochaetales bacterium]|nr:YigZ family protein [Spirochaetales bacterium]